MHVFVERKFDPHFDPRFDPLTVHLWGSKGIYIPYFVGGKTKEKALKPLSFKAFSWRTLRDSNPRPFGP